MFLEEIVMRQPEKEKLIKLSKLDELMREKYSLLSGTLDTLCSLQFVALATFRLKKMAALALRPRRQEGKKASIELHTDRLRIRIKRGFAQKVTEKWGT